MFLYHIVVDWLESLGKQHNKGMSLMGEWREVELERGDIEYEDMKG